jgi:hypothetical protein
MCKLHGPSNLLRSRVLAFLRDPEANGKDEKRALFREGVARGYYRLQSEDRDRPAVAHNKVGGSAQ